MREINTSDKRFHNGNGRNEMGTVVTAEWLNAVQDELVGVIKGLGEQVDPSKPNQIWQLLAEEFGKKVGVEHSHTTVDIAGLQEALDEAGKKGLPVGSVVAFPRAVANPVGFLKCDGTSFTQSLYPDLYRVLGNQNKLPDLTRSDVGMTAYFATDNIPAGWIAFDQIRTQVTQSAYPELYRHLVAKYGSIDAVPLAEDRFLRNASGDLTVGQTQEDAIKKHTHAQVNTGDVINEPAFTNYYDKLKDPDGVAKHVQYYDTVVNNNVWMMPKLSSLFATGDNETRPKSLTLKLCIKAQNSLDDVQFWIKSFGAVDNQGMMDASHIAISLQGKANVGHQHSYTEIANFADGVKTAFTQNLAENGWQKLPNGLIEQWGKLTLNPIGGSGTDTQVVFPVAFPGEVLNVQVSYGLMTNARITQDPVLAELSLSGMSIRQQSDRGVVVYWRVIGK